MMAGPRIVILGGGFAGAYCAQGLERRLGRRQAEVVLLDRHNYFTFYPLLIEAGTGSLEPRHAVVGIRAFLKKTGFVMAEVESIDFDARRVIYRLIGDEALREQPYDQLVLAVGSVTRLPDVPGLREHGYQMKRMGDAIALRDRSIQLLELANAIDDQQRRRALLHFVVVGGNFTGVEVAGEFDMFVRSASRAYRRLGPADCQVTLIEVTGRILNTIGAGFSDFALHHLQRRGITVRLNTSVTKVEPDGVQLSTGERLGTHTVIWCAGIEPTPLVQRLGLPKDQRGYILCDRDLRVSGHENVWSIGDCAVNLDAAGKAYPATAQHAVRQGVHLADNLVRLMDGQAALPCDIVSKGSLAALGCRTGVGDVFGIKVSGFPAWFLWRTVYLMKTPGLARKLRVALDWTMDFVFPREHVQLGVHGQGRS